MLLPMSLPPQKKREILLFLVYNAEGIKEIFDGLDDLIMHTLKIPRSAVREMLPKAENIIEMIPQIDMKIQNCAIAISDERICGLERAILRLSIYELLIEKELTAPIIISEALRLVSKFGNPSFSSFIHAVLGAMVLPEALPNALPKETLSV